MLRALQDFSQIHYFADIGYRCVASRRASVIASVRDRLTLPPSARRHNPFQHCPKGVVHENRCYCEEGETFNDHWCVHADA